MLREPQGRHRGQHHKGPMNCQSSGVSFCVHPNYSLNEKHLEPGAPAPSESLVQQPVFQYPVSRCSSVQASVDPSGGNKVPGDLSGDK